MRGFVGEFGVGEFEHLADENGEVWSTFGVTGQPSFVFIDDSGEFTRINGRLGDDGLRERLDALL